METKVGEEAINHKEIVSHDHLICNALYSEVFNQVSSERQQDVCAMEQSI